MSLNRQDNTDGHGGGGGCGDDSDDDDDYTWNSCAMHLFFGVGSSVIIHVWCVKVSIYGLYCSIQRATTSFPCAIGHLNPSQI